ncbi:hypothetical protein AMECASPLE_021585, partial [Ameca splendens]
CNITKIIVRDCGAVLHEGKVHLEEAHRNRMRVTLRITWLLLSLMGRGEAGVHLQLSMGRRRGSPWTGRQAITGQLHI